MIQVDINRLCGIGFIEDHNRTTAVSVPKAGNAQRCVVCAGLDSHRARADKTAVIGESPQTPGRLEAVTDDFDQRRIGRLSTGFVGFCAPPLEIRIHLRINQGIPLTRGPLNAGTIARTPIPGPIPGVKSG